MKRLSERMADDGDMECHVFVDDVAELEHDLDAERSRCMDLAARLDRARTELRAAEVGMAVVHFFDLARMQEIETLERFIADNVAGERDDERARAERAEGKLRRVRERYHVPTIYIARDVLAILDEESGP